MKYCRKKIVWSVLENDGVKNNLKILRYNYFLHFDRTSRIICEKYDEKCYDQWYLSIILNMHNY